MAENKWRSLVHSYFYTTVRRDRPWRVPTPSAPPMSAALQTPFPTILFPPPCVASPFHPQNIQLSCLPHQLPKWSAIASSFHLLRSRQVLEGQERASIQTQGIADGLTETSAKLEGLSDSLSQELVSAMKEIEKQVSIANLNYRLYLDYAEKTNRNRVSQEYLRRMPFPSAIYLIQVRSPTRKALLTRPLMAASPLAPLSRIAPRK